MPSIQFDIEVTNAVFGANALADALDRIAHAAAAAERAAAGTKSAGAIDPSKLEAAAVSSRAMNEHLTKVVSTLEKIGRTMSKVQVAEDISKQTDNSKWRKIAESKKKSESEVTRIAKEGLSYRLVDHVRYLKSVEVYEEEYARRRAAKKRQAVTDPHTRGKLDAEVELRVLNELAGTDAMRVEAMKSLDQLDQRRTRNLIKDGGKNLRLEEKRHQRRLDWIERRHKKIKEYHETERRENRRTRNQSMRALEQEQQVLQNNIDAANNIEIRRSSQADADRLSATQREDRLTDRQTEQDFKKGERAFDQARVAAGGLYEEEVKLERQRKNLSLAVKQGITNDKEAAKIMDQYKKRLKESGAAMKGFQSSLQKVAGAFAVITFGPLSGIGSRIIAFNNLIRLSAEETVSFRIAVLGAAAAIGVFYAGLRTFQFLKKVAADLDKLQKTADRLGISFENLQELNFVGARSGIESMDQVLYRLSRAVGDATRETGEARKAFDDLGVNWRELAKMNPTEQIITLSNAYVALGDAQKGVSIATQIWGARQSRVINVLLTRGGGIQKMIEQARELGLILDEQAGRQAEHFTDRMYELDQQVKVLGQRIAIELMPEFERMARYLVVNLPAAINVLVRAINTLPYITIRTVSLMEEELQKISDLQRRQIDYGGDNPVTRYAQEQLTITRLVYEAFIAVRKASNQAELDQAIAKIQLAQKLVNKLFNEADPANQALFLNAPEGALSWQEAFEVLKDARAEADLFAESLKRWHTLTGTGSNEVADLVKTTWEQLRQMNNELETAERNFLHLDSPLNDFVNALRFEDIANEVDAMLGNFLKMEGTVENHLHLLDLIKRTAKEINLVGDDTPGHGFLDIDPKAISDSGRAVGDFTGEIEHNAQVLRLALFDWLEYKAALEGTNQVMQGLTESTRVQLQDILLIQDAVGADRSAITQRINEETAARDANNNKIEEETQRLIDLHERLTRELVRRDRLIQFGEDFEDVVGGAIENTLNGGIRNFEDFFEAVLQGWRNMAAQFVTEQIFKPENFGFGSTEGIGGLLNTFGFSFGDAVTARQRTLDSAVLDTATSSGITAANTKILGDVGKLGVAGFDFASGVNQNTGRITAGAGGTIGGTIGDASGLAPGSQFTGILGALVVGGIGYLLGQSKPFDIDASGAERVAANTLILGTTTAASLALGGLAVEAGLLTGSLASIIGPLAALAPYLLVLAALAAVAILLVDVFSKPPRDIELDLRTTETQEELFRRSHQAGSRGAFREGPFGFIGLHVQSGPGDAQELQWQQTLLESILKLDQAIAKTLLPEEIERVALVLQNASTTTKATPAGIESLLDQVLFRGIYSPDYVSPEPAIIPGPGMGIRWRDSTGYLRESNGDYVEDKFGTQDYRKPWTQRDIDELSRLTSQSPIFESGNIHSVLLTDPTNDIGYIIARRVELAFAALNMDAGFFGLDVASTGGFIPDDYFQKLSEVMKVRIEYIRSLDTLAGEPVTQSLTSLRKLEDQFEEMASLAEALGFTLEDLAKRFEFGMRVLKRSFQLDIDVATYGITDPFISTLEGIRNQSDIAFRNALDLEVSTEPAFELHLLRVADALEKFVAPVTAVLDAIAIDRAAPLETLDILEARFLTALADNDPGAAAKAATDYISKLEQTFGRTDDYFEESVKVEAQLLAFNERMAEMADAQIDLTRQQLDEMKEGNLTRADQLDQIIAFWRSIADTPIDSSTIGASQDAMSTLFQQFEAARSGSDPYLMYEASANLLQATEAVYGAESDTYYERSAFVESSIAAFSDRLSEQHMQSTDIAQQQLLAIQTGNEVSAQLLQSILDVMNGIREDNGDILDAFELANAKKKVG